jgi:uncharacterized membrane protein
VTAVTPSLQFVALMGNAVAGGIMLSTVLGIVPLMLTLPYERYVELVQFMWPRYDPFMPIANLATLLADAALAVTVRHSPARGLFGLAAVLIVSVITISVTRNVPINRYVGSLDPGQRPADWRQADPRARWRHWNLIRTGLMLCALVANVAGAVA